MNEATIKRDILRRLGRGPVRVFNNPVGSAWQGIATRLPNGDVLLHNPRRVVYGLCPGSSDLIGWRTVEVTPEMVLPALVWRRDMALVWGADIAAAGGIQQVLEKARALLAE